MTTASTSAWTWHSDYSLYYNATTKQWAAPQPDGSWKYSSREAGSENDQGAGASGQLEEGELDQPDDEDYQTWPGGAEPEEEEDPLEKSRRESFASAPLMRLVVKSVEASVLPKGQTIAVLDPAEPVSIGRDRCHERRIRLKELAVSKDHCTLFWAIDQESERKGYWAVVDNGSTHGTFIKGDGEKKETRLSEPKVTSKPSRLHHFDTLRCGSTAFDVHIHTSFACSLCTVSSDSSNVIPLLPVQKVHSLGSQQVPAAYHTKTKEEKEFERREQMKGLREKLLKPSSKPDVTPVTAATEPPCTASAQASSSPAFVDRAAARRARDAGSISTATKRKRAVAPSPFFAVPGATNSSSSSTFLAPPSKAPLRVADPFSSESKGAKLLSKMSGEQGGGAIPVSNVNTHSPLSSSGQSGLGTLIAARTLDKGAGLSGTNRDSRPGLGSRPLVAIDQLGQEGRGGGDGVERDWRENVREASRKRFKEMG